MSDSPTTYEKGPIEKVMNEVEQLKEILRERGYSKKAIEAS